MMEKGLVSSFQIRLQEYPVIGLYTIPVQIFCPKIMYGIRKYM